uniref:Uncharacterized protein n=1 Tax=Sinocyclocheilus rhinocerous TaxID=307959 RepID=A0A673LP28_9TELE
MTDLNCQSNALVSALAAFAFLVSSTCIFYRPVIITRMGNFTSAAPGLSSSACTQFVQVSLYWFVLVHSIQKISLDFFFQSCRFESV